MGFLGDSLALEQKHERGQERVREIQKYKDRAQRHLKLNKARHQRRPQFEEAWEGCSGRQAFREFHWGLGTRKNKI